MPPSPSEARGASLLVLLSIINEGRMFNCFAQILAQNRALDLCRSALG